MRGRLDHRQQEVRADLLRALSANAKMPEAAALAETWLPTHPYFGPVCEAVAELREAQAAKLAEAGQLNELRIWLGRIDEEFPSQELAPKARKMLQVRAEELVQQARGLPDAQAMPMLKQARQLWPGLDDVHPD